MARLGTESAAKRGQVALAASLLEATLDPEETLRALCQETRRALVDAFLAVLSARTGDR